MIHTEKKYYAEFNTDQHIREKYFPDYSYKGIMVEVGAGPTNFYSMSKHFRDNGWRTICVDPDGKCVIMHKAENREIYQYACSNYDGKSKFKVVSSGWDEKNDGISYSALDIKYNMPNHKYSEIDVEVLKLDTLLEKLSIDKVDYVSIDVEGWELEVIEGFNVKKYQPKIIVLENFQYDENYVLHMNKIDYILSDKIKYNYIFIKK